MLARMAVKCIVCDLARKIAPSAPSLIYITFSIRLNTDDFSLDLYNIKFSESLANISLDIIRDKTDDDN